MNFPIGIDIGEHFFLFFLNHLQIFHQIKCSLLGLGQQREVDQDLPFKVAAEVVVAANRDLPGEVEVVQVQRGVEAGRGHQEEVAVGQEHPEAAPDLPEVNAHDQVTLQHFIQDRCHL